MDNRGVESRLRIRESQFKLELFLIKHGFRARLECPVLADSGHSHNQIVVPTNHGVVGFDVIARSMGQKAFHFRSKGGR